MKKTRLMEIIREVIQEELSLQELSPKTMKSYIKKASSDAQDQYDDYLDPFTSPKHREHASKQLDRRVKGIKNAHTKINKLRKPGETWTTSSGRKAKKNQDGTITYSDK